MTTMRCLSVARRLWLLRVGISIVMVASAAVFTGSAWSQLGEMTAGMAAAKEIQDTSLAKGALILCGLCVGALVAGFKFVWAIHVEIVKTAQAQNEALLKVAMARSDDMDKMGKRIEELTDAIEGNVGADGRGQIRSRTPRG